MPIENRVAVCDVCGRHEREPGDGVGWLGWLRLQGIGAVEPIEGQPVQTKNLEMWVCTDCKPQLVTLLDAMQEAAQ